MDLNFLCVLIWGVVGALAYSTTMGRRWSGAGFTLAFFLNLSLLHWFSGMILLLPWYYPAEYNSTVAGFQTSTVGIVAFAIGCFGVTPLLTRRPDHASESVPAANDSRIFRIFLAIGLCCFAFGAIGLAKIPTLSAFFASGQSFVFVALGFGLWQAYLRQNRRQMWILLAVTPIFPLLTVVLQGFLGFGVGYAIIVLCFLVAIYRPRLWATLLVLPLIYVGLSVYVTYMRDRDEIRDVVWGGSKLEERVDQTKRTFGRFEWFNLHNDQHLNAVNNRLNYNWLVGAEISHLDATRAFGNGETIWMSVLALIPRAVWPNKPIQAGSMDFVSHYTGLKFAEGTSVGMGLIFEFYANFGTYGVLFGMFVMGIVVGYTDRRAGEELRWGSPLLFARWALIGIPLLTVGGSLIDVTPGIILAVAWTAGLRHLFVNSALDNRQDESNLLSTVHTSDS
ncbi:MAG TPA: hypothetical protein VL171_09670 [Verrucomicrobiae bacterium]|nr:hypothetical protein [Verrucomicrobiae bacterium]